VYRSILVPLDGSSFGEQALPLALSIARRAGATLHLVTVHVPIPPLAEECLSGFDPRIDIAAKRHSQTYLDHVVKRLAGVTEVPLIPTVIEGPVADALCERAAAAGIDLIVMTTHGRGGLARAWLGSVADDLIRRVTVPILLVRPQDTAPAGAQEPTLPNVLIPLDGSNLAEQVLEPAVALGTLMEAEFTLMRVIRPLVIGAHPIQPGPAPGLQYPVVKELQVLHEQERREADNYLEAVARRLRDRSLRVQTRVMVDDQPALAILAEAKVFPNGLIALETHGRSSVARLFLGSVADKLVRGATLPVLVHHSLRK
jgi:nucleotide-binding universal stress UspA family protein